MKTGSGLSSYACPLALFLCLICCCCCSQYSSAQSEPTPRLHPQEIDTLKRIDKKLGVGWNFSVDPCSGKNGWLMDKSEKINNIVSNLTCGNCDANKTCHVETLRIKTQNLTGVLPSEIAELTSLKDIDLTRNYINGSIPPEWGTLPRLVNMSLGNNRISGTIPPEIGNISTLRSLVLENNLLTGSIPSDLGRLENLQRLIVSSNDLTGRLPSSLGNLANLTDFRIDGSGISGKIPQFIRNWRRLLRLHMQGTSLEGPFPPVFSSLTELTELLVSDLKGVQSFPLNITSNIKYIILRNCSISGELPEYIGDLNKLDKLDLSFNNFTGEIPNIYRNLRPKALYLNNNRLSGSIPAWITKSNKKIDLSFNDFEGPPPEQECSPTGSRINMLASLSSSRDRSIPPCFRKNYPCPGRAKNHNLYINCGGDVIKVGDDLYDKDDTLLGASNSHHSDDKKWALSSTGDFFNKNDANYIVTNKTVLDISNPTLYTTARQCPSSLTYYGLCLINGNYTVNLHFAEIMFIDNKTYYGVGRRFFDVFIQGELILEDFNIAAEAGGFGRNVTKSFLAVVDGNTLQIGFRWSGKGTNSVPEKGVYGSLISAISVTPNFPLPDDGLSNGAIIGIVVTSTFGGVVLIALALRFLEKIRRHHNENGFQAMNLQTNQFTLRQIRSATRNFDRSCKIGEGGFGPVYKGVLPDGTIVAVKQLSSKSKQGTQEFVNEIGLISSLQHPNLIKIFGCCIEENQLLLVYEYCENNSLSHVLFGPNAKGLKLDWKTRCKVCIGMAKALAYLHEESRLKVVHRDIKASNVLLDRNLEPKISDFGLAKLDDKEHTHLSTRIAGTTGYMAPEYAVRGHLTEKADVYSFGIVMLEVMSGRSSISHAPDEHNIYLLDVANELEESGKILQLVDESMGSDYSEEEAVKMIKLALLCANTNPSIRPTMTSVVSTLESKRPVPIPSMRRSMSRSQEEKLKNYQESIIMDDDHIACNGDLGFQGHTSLDKSSLSIPSYYSDDVPR